MLYETVDESSVRMVKKVGFESLPLVEVSRQVQWFFSTSCIFLVLYSSYRCRRRIHNKTCRFYKYERITRFPGGLCYKLMVSLRAMQNERPPSRPHDHPVSLYSVTGRWYSRSNKLPQCSHISNFQFEYVLFTCVHI